MARKYDKGQKTAKKFVNSQNEISDDLLSYSTYLARLEQIVGSRILPENINESLLSQEVKEVINELRKICVVFENGFMIPENLTSKSDVVFNPHFGMGSKACGGADAEVFIDDRVLYDFKTTKKTGYAWQDITQIFGYYFFKRNR